MRLQAYLIHPTQKITKTEVEVRITQNTNKELVIRIVEGGVTGVEHRVVDDRFISAVHKLNADWTAWKGSYNLPDKLVIPNAELRKLL